MELVYIVVVWCLGEVFISVIRQLSNWQRRYFWVNSDFFIIVYVWCNVGIKLMYKGNLFMIWRQVIFGYFIGVV